MEIKLRDNKALVKYDLYQEGNLIVRSDNTVLLVTASLQTETKFAVAELNSGWSSSGHPTLEELADVTWLPGDRLMANPILVEEGAE